MSRRDKLIIADLERFRCMSRDDIIDLYFKHLKSPIASANAVLKRLVRDQKIKVSRSFSPFVYFPAESNMKKNSTKIPHFLKIVEVYKQLKQYCDPYKFIVEPKFQKGLAEPDVLTVIKGTPFFIEIQRNLYSQKVMDQKIKRYEALALSGEFKKLPFIIMVSDVRYKVNSDDVTVFQVSSIQEFMMNVNKKDKAQSVADIKYKIG